MLNNECANLFAFKLVYIFLPQKRTEHYSPPTTMQESYYLYWCYKKLLLVLLVRLQIQSTFRNCIKFMNIEIHYLRRITDCDIILSICHFNEETYDSYVVSRLCCIQSVHIWRTIIKFPCVYVYFQVKMVLNVITNSLW